MMSKKSISIYLIILALTNICFFSCKKNSNYHKTEGIIWNTVYHITYCGPETLKDSILPVLNSVGHSLSVFEENSLVSQLNRGDSIEADSHLIMVFDAAKKIHTLSEGRFDPTVSPLIDAWGFGRGHTPTSDTLDIDNILLFIGMDKTLRINNTIKKNDSRIQFNFSAIAKGYGCDAVGDMFKRNGVNEYMIEIGGEIALSGKSPSGNLWKIGVDAPVEDGKPGEETALILTLTDVGIATSGNYRNYWVDESGNKTAHTISPLTGRPFIGNILSATVVSSNCMEADGLATACMASNLQQAISLLKEAHAEGLLIMADSIWTSPGFSKFLKN